jgi:5-methylcytosine-specific restriction protein A
MPQACPRFCPRCSAPHPSGAECPRSRAERLAALDKRRPSASKRGYTAEWGRARAAFLQENPRCAVSNEPAREVHHSIPHRGDMKLFWDKTKWVSLCRSHHSAATMTEMNARRNV